MTQQATLEAAPAGEQGELAQASLPAEQNGTADQALIADELLVEEVSIDGMCGVY
jgi:mycofactocin precursor